jgi:preprotein translocase subunit SecG
MLTTLLQVLHVFVCAVLMFVVLLQQGKGGGMGSALGGGGAAQVFGGRGAGNILTRVTAIAAGTFMLTSVALAYRSSMGDRALRNRAAVEETKHATKTAAAPAAPAPVAPAPAPATSP